MKWLLILGAGSDIAGAIAGKFAAEGVNLYLAHRDENSIRDLAKDIEIRNGVKAVPVSFDALKSRSHREFYESLPEKPDGVICVFGYLGDNSGALIDFSEAERIIDTNYKGAVSILNIAAADFRNRKSGFIAGISSVAGDRGRGSNLFYGSAKAGFTAYLSGLRNMLSASGVRVLTVKPGFVNTRMTEGMNTPGILTAEPEDAAKKIFEAWKKKKDVIYVPGIWRYIMLMIIHIPESVFKRLSL